MRFFAVLVLAALLPVAMACVHEYGSVDEAHVGGAGLWTAGQLRLPRAYPSGSV